jgi:hypothetical protein
MFIGGQSLSNACSKHGGDRSIDRFLWTEVATVRPCGTTGVVSELACRTFGPQKDTRLSTGCEPAFPPSIDNKGSRLVGPSAPPPRRVPPHRGDSQVVAPRVFAVEPAKGRLTDPLCWSRMQAEAGQSLERIIIRKELERQANGGIFYWGVGNAPSQAIHSLAEEQADVDVVFSVMKTRPRVVDLSPTEVWIWRAYIDSDGQRKPLPPGTVVTSRGQPGQAARRGHYALVCRSGVPLSVGGNRRFNPNAYRNCGDAGAPVGHSQVTALLRRVTRDRGGDYRINLRAKLAAGYWVRLADAAMLDADHVKKLNDVDASLALADWHALACELRESSPPRGLDDIQLTLL